MRIVRNVLVILVAIGIIVIIGVALTCTGNDDGDDGESNGTPETGTPVPGDEEFEATVDAIILVVREGQGPELRPYLGATLLEQVDDAALDALASCVPEGVTLTLVDPTLEELGNDATATLEFEVTNADGETTDVTGVWNFELDDGDWLLKELPPCPVEAA